MQRIILVYGTISGLIVISTMIAGFSLSDGQGGFSSEWFGYLIMLVVLSLIFVGIKRYRDTELGGVIRFTRALLLGAGIAAVAGVAYVVVWELYLAFTDYAFIDLYTKSVIDAKEAAGASAEEMQAEIARMEELRTAYANPLFRIPITFSEIFPVGLLISLISATLLRNPQLLPAQD